MAVADKDNLILRSTGGDSGNPDLINWNREDRLSGVLFGAVVAGKLTTYWTADGNPGGGAAPGGTPRNPDRTTDGALKQTNAGAGRKRVMAFASAVSNSQGCLLFYDRLYDISGLSSTNTNVQSITSSVTRYTNGVGNEIWLEIYSGLGSSPSSIVVNYVDQNNAAKTTPLTTIGSVGFNVQTCMIRIPNAIGGPGVKSVTSVDLTASTGLAGNFGVTIAHPLIYVSPPTIGLTGIMNVYDTIVEIEPDACIAMAWYNGSTVGARFGGQCFFLDL